jgi:prepilin-type N-terminal cleavage/methylation domain-containing protein
MKMRQKGFTLIELLIVIVIIGILASIVLLGVGRVQPAARDARRVAELRQVQHALEVYYRKCSYYPGRGDGMGNPCGAGFADISADMIPWATMTASLLDGGTLGFGVVPDDPNPSVHYSYGTNAIGSAYVLGAFLEEDGSPLFASSIGGNGDKAAAISLGGNMNVTFHCGATAMPPKMYCIEY